jgi:regulator of sigma E protease
MLMTILPDFLTNVLQHWLVTTIVVLGVLIFVHELGHFLTAKLVDIEVPRFSIGFGPKLIGFRRGETEYVISALPLGGYVKMAGMEEMEMIEGKAVGLDSEPAQSGIPEPGSVARSSRHFESKSLPARTLVISAGVLMNFLFAFVVFTASAAGWGVSADPGTTIGGITEDILPDGAESLAGIEPGARVVAINDQSVSTRREMALALTRARAGETRISFENAPAITLQLPASDSARGGVIAALEPALPVPPVLPAVVSGGPAHRAGLQPGDRIVQAGEREVTTWQQFIAVIEHSPGEPVPLVVNRNEQEIRLTVTPRDTVLANGIRVGRIGVHIPQTRDYEPRTRPTPLQALQRGAQQTWDITVLTVDAIEGFVTRRRSARELGGPIMIGQLSSRFAQLGLEEYLGFMAILSINLALLNLLPIPVLDGGQLVFLAIEAVRGRPLSMESRARLTQVGFVFIILLMAWAIGNDILRQFGI